MKKSSKGNIVLSYFNKKNSLSDACRKHIVENVVEHLIENKIQASPKCMDTIADSIVSFFNFEVKVCFINILMTLYTNVLFNNLLYS